MLKYRLTHPEILAALGAAGHGAQVLIADGNYPFSTHANPSARRVFLNLTPGIVTATEVLAALVDALVIESATVMMPASGQEPAIFQEFRQLLPPGMPLKTLGRFEFYDASIDPSTALVIATGEQRIYANILLTIGVVPPPEDSR